MPKIECGDVATCNLRRSGAVEVPIVMPVAVTNAIARAIGVCVRWMPMPPNRVLQRKASVGEG
jgi:hypothetical protein